MVAFRKVFPVLAILGMLIGLTSTASAQGVSCVANSGVPPLVRAEGYTELVGDVVLTCTGGTAANPFLANFQLFLNTNITSRLISGISEATLLIDEPGAPVILAGGATGGPKPFCPAPNPTLSTGTTGGTNSSNAIPAPGIPGANNSQTIACNPYDATQSYQTGTYNAFVANSTSQNNAVVWPGIPVVPPATAGTRTFRFTNIRANAAGLGTSNTLIPTQIVAFISVSGSQAITINNPQQTVGYVQQGLQFSLTKCDGTAGSAVALSQCVANGSGFPASDIGTFGLKFREGFQNAFKPRITLPAQATSVPGVPYNSESGFVRAGGGVFTGAAGGPGYADSGTKLSARFNNIPAGVRLFVTVSSVAQAAATPTATAALVSADTNGNGGSVIAASGTILRCAGTSSLVAPSAVNGIELTVSNGTAIATWEVTGSDPSVLEDAFFLVGIATVPNTANNLPGLGTSTVTGNFAPFYAAASGANVASATLPVPRFIDNPISTNSFTISSCQTNLLFPFVTNQAGFDTGIAISNTSRDPFATPTARLQAGRCTINYYGTTTNGGAAPAAQTSTANVDPGSQLTFVLSSGGNLGVAGTPGFQGYIIAQCNFQYAHGFAFITDGPIGQARVAEGYLALVLDAAIPSRGTLSEVLAH